MKYITALVVPIVFASFLFFSGCSSDELLSVNDGDTVSAFSKDENNHNKDENNHNKDENNHNKGENNHN